jgi:hypothetical protein
VEDGTPAELIARYGRQTLEDVFLDIARGRQNCSLARDRAGEMVLEEANDAP